jgi:hypothetical protein
LRFLINLKDAATKLCVDEGFSFEEAKNKSHIGSEYLFHLRVGSLGYEIIVHLGRLQRIKIVPRAVPQAVAKTIKRQVGKGADRTYVRVAFNSDDKILASHDFGDLTEGVRTRLCEKIKVRVVGAKDAATELSLALFSRRHAGHDRRSLFGSIRPPGPDHDSLPAGNGRLRGWRK